MLDRFDPLWIFLGGLILRYGGDLARILGKVITQRLTSTLTIAETNPIYGAICWELDRTGQVKNFNELIYTIAPLIPTAIESPTLQTKLQPRNGSVMVQHQGAYLLIYRHDFKVTDVQTTQMLSLLTFRHWQAQMFNWLQELERAYSQEAPLTVRLYGANSAIVRTQTKRRRERWPSIQPSKLLCFRI